MEIKINVSANIFFSHTLWTILLSSPWRLLLSLPRGAEMTPNSSRIPPPQQELKKEATPNDGTMKLFILAESSAFLFFSAAAHFAFSCQEPVMCSGFWAPRLHFSNSSSQLRQVLSFIRLHLLVRRAQKSGQGASEPSGLLLTRRERLGTVIFKPL